VSKPQIILITPGEPSGIGPDIVLDIAQFDWDATLIIIGDPEILKSRALQLNKNIRLIVLDSVDTLPKKESQNEVYVLPVKCKHDVNPGQLNSKYSQYVLDF